MIFLVFFLIILVLQFGLSFLFVNVLHLNYYVADTLIDLVLAFVFAYLNYRGGPRKLAFKDPNYHRSVLMYFVVLVLISCLYWFVF